METSRLISCFILISSVLLPLCAALESGRYYHLRNDAENSYLKVESGGALCENLGFVTTSSTLDENSIAFRWRYNELLSIWRWLDIDTTNPQGFQLNELTVQEREDSCEPFFRLVNTRQIVGNLYRIIDESDKTCLVSNGVGKRISFATCDTESSAQQWVFIET
ncbi:hypothetical protein Ocin01_16854 [Orchesella cincta]|uniref:Ricin B lectin domain-containing protein n=1 Tax=Orchesella cincta TaxID=48709 RepID=A0A1D2MA34_ORCCI|nr:hypothetical protein Ocin01_16854 [Orchesella cincta]